MVSHLRAGGILPDHVTCDMIGAESISQTLLNSPGRSRPAAMAAAMRTLLGCTTIQVTPHQQLHGSEATKIDYRDPRYPKIQQALWVSESTFLPVQGVFTLLDGKSTHDFTTSFTWLSPTNANKAQLSTPIPAGFKVTTRSESIAYPFPFPLFGEPCPAAECPPEPAATPSASASASTSGSASASPGASGSASGSGSASPSPSATK